MSEGEAALRVILETLGPDARDTLRRALIHRTDLTQQTMVFALQSQFVVGLPLERESASLTWKFAKAAATRVVDVRLVVLHRRSDLQSGHALVCRHLGTNELALTMSPQLLKVRGLP